MLKATTSVTSKTDFLEGSVLLFNKPLKWSSFDLVKKIRNIIKSSSDIEKIKIGHAGTLDPLAEGLLIICTGKLTKKIEEIQKQKKKYSGELILGKTTPSYDKETEINNTFKICHITKEMIHRTCKQFKGKIMQRPPIFSALKQNGKRLYEHAREGSIIKINHREIEVDYFKITGINMPKIKFEVLCGKGTYIRSLAHDFGVSLQSGAYLSSLKRDQIGKYNLSDAFSIQDFQESILK